MSVRAPVPAQPDRKGTQPARSWTRCQL